MVCGEEKVVFSAGDESTGKVVTLCEGCAKDIGDVPTSEVIEKYGKVDKKAFKDDDAINVMGIDKLQEELKKRKASSEEK
jgi:hypothetical protein